MKKVVLKKHIVIIASLVLALFFGLILWFKPNADSMNKNQDNILIHTQLPKKDKPVMTNYVQKNTKNLEQVSITKKNVSFESGLENLPRSLQGTDVDGDIIIDENNNLVVTFGLRRLFDYFLSVQGEEETVDINARIQAYISSRTPEPASSTAIALYHQYIAYLKEMNSLKTKYSSLQLQVTQNGAVDFNLVQQRRYDINNIRKNYFEKDTISAFFTDDDALETITVELMKVEGNSQLSLEEKQQAKQEIISRQPESPEKKAMQQFNKQQQKVATLLEQTERMKKQNASTEQLFEMRANLVGVDAAQRLAKLDQETLDFDNRVNTYNQKRQDLIKLHGIEKATTYISSLEKKLFSTTEQKRLTGYNALKNSRPVSK